MALNFPSFVDAFGELVEPMGTPKEFALWSGLWALSAAIERRVWIYTTRRVLYPNLFCVLIAPPGIGKTTAIVPAKQLVDSIGDHRTAENSITFASYVDGLREAQRTIIHKTGEATTYYCLNIAAPEFQYLLPSYDTTLLGKFTHIYDGGEVGEARRGSKEGTFHLDKVLATLLAGTTPEHLFSTFPESAWGTGFMSRTILVWSTDIRIGDLFQSDEEADEVEEERFKKALSQDLKQIAERYGRFRFDPAGAAAANGFYKAGPFGGEPLPSHPRLLNYSTRRPAHLLKLMMLSALDRGEDEMLLRARDYERAYEWLVGAELRMPEIFKAGGGLAGDSQVTGDLHHFISEMYIKYKKPVPLFKAKRFLVEKGVQAFKVDAIVETAISAKWFRTEMVKGAGTCLVPLAQMPSEDEPY